MWLVDLSFLMDLHARGSHKFFDTMEHAPFSEEMQRSLLGSLDEDWISYALRSPYSMPHLIEEVLSSKYTLANSRIKSQLVLARRDETIHSRLADDVDEDVVCTVAELTPFPAVSERLMRSTNVTILWSLAMNHNLTKDHYRRLSLVPEKFIHDSLIGFNRLPEVLDASWGACMILGYDESRFEELMEGLDVREAKTLAETWRGSVESLREALALTQR